MELRQVQYFVVVAGQRSFSRAAQAVGVAQPALSQQMKRLESELGVVLLDRSTRPLKVTEAGVAFLARAERMVAEANLARDEMRDFAGVGRGRLVVGALPGLAAFWLPDVLGRFHLAHPGIELVLREANTEELSRLLGLGQLDLALLHAVPGLYTGHPSHRGIVMERLFDEELVVIVAPGHPLAHRASVRLGALPDGTQLLLHSLLLIAFCIKAAVFPLSAWLPDSYPTAPAPVTAVFAGLLTKVGVYAIIRTQTLLFPDGALDDVLMWAALATMLIGILGAVAQTDLRRILSFTLVSHIGYMVFGIALGTTAGLAGAIFYVAHHIAIQTTLFLVAGLIERQGGSTAVDRLGGLAAGAPVLAVLFFVPAMNLAGIPPLSGFIGKLGLLEAGVAAGTGLAHLLVAGGVVTSLLTLIVVARVWTRAFWRPSAQAPADDTAAAAAADAGPETGDQPAGGPGAELGKEWEPELEPVAVGASGVRRAARQAAWRRHTDVATAAGTDADGPAGEQRLLPRVMVATTAAMVALTVALTGIAGPLYGLTDRAAADLLERTPYIESVFGTADVP